ncbi:hypothetical protein PCE1_002648 [Barthelona sp. PCE]
MKGALLCNRAVRNYLSRFNEKDWNNVVIATMIYGIQALEANGHLEKIELHKLQDVVRHNVYSKSIEEQIPALKNDMNSMMQDLRVLTAFLDGVYDFDAISSVSKDSFQNTNSQALITNERLGHIKNLALASKKHTEDSRDLKKAVFDVLKDDIVEPKYLNIEAKVSTTHNGPDIKPRYRAHSGKPKVKSMSKPKSDLHRIPHDAIICESHLPADVGEADILFKGEGTARLMEHDHKPIRRKEFYVPSYGQQGAKKPKKKTQKRKKATESRLKSVITGQKKLSKLLKEKKEDETFKTNKKLSEFAEEDILLPRKARPNDYVATVDVSEKPKPNNVKEIENDGLFTVVDSLIDNPWLKSFMRTEDAPLSVPEKVKTEQKDDKLDFSLLNAHNIQAKDEEDEEEEHYSLFQSLSR